MSDNQKPQDEAGPEEGLRVRLAIPKDDDTEGHGWKPPAVPDGEEPGPDEAKGDQPDQTTPA